MSEELIIRAASAADYGSACLLLDSLDALHRERLPWLFRAPETEARTTAYFEQWLAAGDAHVLLADAGEVVGIAIVLLRAAPDFAVFIPQRWAVLDNLVVAPSWRRRGIARSLTRAAEEWASAQGAAWLELGVYEFNHEARSFYEALGYVPLSRKLRKGLSSP